MYNVCHISPQNVKIKDVKSKEKKMGLWHRLTIWMFVDIPKKLLCCLSVHIIKGFYLVRITFFNTFFSDMILEMKPIDVHPRSFAQLLRHLVFLLLFLHSQLIFQDGSCHCKGCTLMLSMSIIRQADMEFVQKFTPPEFLAKNFTPSISPNFNSFSKKKTQKNEWKWRNLHRWQKFYTAAGTDGMDKFHLCPPPFCPLIW